MNDARPAITVEFYGVPRLRAGRGTLSVRAGTVGELLDEVVQACPALAGSLDGLSTHTSDCLLSINGVEFVNDPQRELGPDDTVLLMSADPGG